MKNLLIMLLLCVFSASAQAQSRTAAKKASKQPATLVTKAMSEKIADMCLNSVGYSLGVFYESNRKLLTPTDIFRGKGREILNSLDKHPEYSENFIRAVFKTWGYNGLKEVGFNDAEIVRCKKITGKIAEE